MRQHEIANVQGRVSVPVDRAAAGPGAAMLGTVAIRVEKPRVTRVAAAGINR